MTSAPAKNIVETEEIPNGSRIERGEWFAATATKSLPKIRKVGNGRRARWEPQTIIPRVHGSAQVELRYRRWTMTDGKVHESYEIRNAGPNAGEAITTSEATEYFAVA